MMKIKSQINFLTILSVMSVWLVAGMAFAGSSSMDEVKSQYRQETGKDWEGASADEKKEFLNILETRRKANSPHYQKKGKFQELKDMSTQKERTPYHVRMSFEHKMGINWDDATEEQQEEFQRDYDLLMKETEREQKARARELELKEEEIQREISAEKREKMSSGCTVFLEKILFALSVFLYPPLDVLYIRTPKIGPGLFIQHGFATTIGAQEIGENCWINQQVTIGFKGNGNRPSIGDNVRISCGAKVLGKLTIGDNSVVGANAVVVKNVPADCTVVGVPAYIIKRNGKKVNERLV